MLATYQPFAAADNLFAQAVRSPVFFSHPFMGAIRQFCDAAAVEFYVCDAVFSQHSNGEMQVSVNCGPTAPPSPLGRVTVTFSFQPGEIDQLRADRELADDAGELITWLPDNGPELEVDLRYFAPSGLSYDDPELVEELLLEKLAGTLSSDPERGDAVVEHVRRRGANARLVGGKPMSWGLSALRHERMSLAEVHARDWARYAVRVRALAQELGDLLREHGEPVSPFAK